MITRRSFLKFLGIAPVAAVVVAAAAEGEARVSVVGVDVARGADTTAITLRRGSTFGTMNEAFIVQYNAEIQRAFNRRAAQRAINLEFFGGQQWTEAEMRQIRAKG